MARRRRPRHEDRSGSRGARLRSAFVLPLALLASILVLGWAGTPAERRPSLSRLKEAELWTRLGDRVARLRERLTSSGSEASAPHAGARPAPAETWIDPAAVSWDWLVNADPRWPDELRAVLAQVEPFRVGDLAALEDLRDVLQSFSFVRSVPYLSASPDRGLELELDLREPVACVPTPDGFLTVDEEGVLLSGLWPAPVIRDGSPLPVIGPMEDAHGLFAYARPGDWLSEVDHLDALDVALSLERHLSRIERRELGRLVIDASRARDASAREPGIRLLLGGRRMILFGRQPSSDEPGELAPAAKWESVRIALESSSDPVAPVDWRTLDVRWDRPELAASESLAVANPRSQPSRRTSTPSPRAERERASLVERDPISNDRPRVR